MQSRRSEAVTKFAAPSRRKYKLVHRLIANLQRACQRAQLAAELPDSRQVLAEAAQMGAAIIEFHAQNGKGGRGNQRAQSPSSPSARGGLAGHEFHLVAPY
jgi:hypothetical protein